MPSTARTLAALALIALIGAAPLAIGGTRLPIKLVLCGLAGLAVVLVAFTRRADKPAAFPWPIWAPVLLIGWYALQLIPLPEGLLSTLSPTAAQLREGGGALSLDPAATSVAVLFQAGFVAVLIAAAAVDRRRQRWILGALAAIGAVVGLIGAIHWTIGTDRIFGLFPARHRGSMTGFFSTFVNNNTLAGLALFSALIAFGLLARVRDGAPRALALGCAGIGVGTVVLSGSRGGQAALVLGALVFALAAWRADPEKDAVMRARVVARIGLVLAVLGLLVAALILPDWQNTAFDAPTDDLKVAAWGPAVDHARDYWLTGSGRDTFQYVYPRYQTITVRNTISHPENIVLQLACEGGVVALALGVGGALFALLYLLRDLRRGSATDWGLLAALVAVSVQQLVDFGFEAAGLAFPVAAGLGVALSRAARARKAEGRARGLRFALIGGLALALATLVFGPRLPGMQADAEVAAWRKSPGDPEPLRARHPADGLLALVVADHLAATGQVEAALPWINRAQRAAPVDPRAHLIAARLFVRADRAGQAASEYRRAYEEGPWMAATIAREIARNLKAPRHLFAAVPAESAAWRHLATALLEASRARELKAVMDEALLFHSKDPGAHASRARACVALADADCAAAEAEWLAQHDAPDEARRIRAEVASRRGDRAAALAALDELGPLADRSPDGLQLTARVAVRLGERTLATTAIDTLLQRFAADPKRAADAHALAAQMHRRFDDRDAALAARSRAYGLDPTPRRALAAAHAAVEAKREAEAQRILDAALERWPRSSRLKAARSAFGP